MFLLNTMLRNFWKNYLLHHFNSIENPSLKIRRLGYDTLNAYINKIIEEAQYTWASSDFTRYHVLGAVTEALNDINFPKYPALFGMVKIGDYTVDSHGVTHVIPKELFEKRTNYCLGIPEGSVYQFEDETGVTKHYINIGWGYTCTPNTCTYGDVLIAINDSKLLNSIERLAEALKDPSIDDLFNIDIASPYVYDKIQSREVQPISEIDVYTLPRCSDFSYALDSYFEATTFCYESKIDNWFFDIMREKLCLTLPTPVESLRKIRYQGYTYMQGTDFSGKLVNISTIDYLIDYDDEQLDSHSRIMDILTGVFGEYLEYARLYKLVEKLPDFLRENLIDWYAAYLQYLISMGISVEEASNLRDKMLRSKDTPRVLVDSRRIHGMLLHVPEIHEDSVQLGTIVTNGKNFYMCVNKALCYHDAIWKLGTVCLPIFPDLTKEVNCNKFMSDYKTSDIKPVMFDEDNFTIVEDPDENIIGIRDAIIQAGNSAWMAGQLYYGVTLDDIKVYLPNDL